VTEELGARLDRLAAETGFAGVVRVDDGDRVALVRAYGLADGIGDYLDEEAMGDITDHVLTVPVHTLATTEGFLAVLDGFPTVFPAGDRFACCNGGHVVLALLAEPATGTPFHDLVRMLVTEPAGMVCTGYLRSDALPGDAAVGYLHAPDHSDPLRINVLHLPVRGNGDGGVYTTVDDVHVLWSAPFAGRIVDPAWVAAMVRPRSDVPAEHKRYGMGFWLHATRPAVVLEGYDAGVSFRTVHDPVRGRTHTVVSNFSEAPGRSPTCSTRCG
jgi:CubicO group peptidase (beta-lactamase class C family)